MNRINLQKKSKYSTMSKSTINFPKISQQNKKMISIIHEPSDNSLLKNKDIYQSMLQTKNRLKKK